MTRKSLNFIKKLKSKRKIVCLTSYTSSITKIIDNYVDIILIGDSLGTAIYGMKNTQNVTLEMMIAHGKAVVSSSKKSFTMIDMPHNTYRTKKEALINAKKLLKSTKSQSVKLETNHSTVDIVKHLTKNKIKVISHIGVTPQNYKNFNDIRSVGGSIKERNKLINLAILLEVAGSSMIVLECMKESLAKEITKKITIPTIGIGASLDCDGQILVINDLLNTNSKEKKPKFVKKYTNIEMFIKKAIKKYTLDVINKKFPMKHNTYL